MVSTHATSWEFCPLQMTNNNARWMSAVARFGFGCMIFLTASVTARAQTYYYYPSSVTSAPTVTTDANVAPTYYYYQVRAGRTAYAPQYYYYQQAPATQYSQPEYQTQAPQAADETQAAQSYGDPYGFTQWLNSTRAAYGLPAVGYDPNLESWAAANNSQQAARGMGHYVMGSARRQNSAVGSVANIGAMWMNSPAHRAALLDPTIRAIGIAGLGAYWTFNAN